MQQPHARIVKYEYTGPIRQRPRWQPEPIESPADRQKRLLLAVTHLESLLVKVAGKDQWCNWSKDEVRRLHANALELLRAANEEKLQ